MDKLSISITDILTKRAKVQPDDVAFIFITDDKQEQKITYKQLYDRSLVLASQLAKQQGERALIMLPSGLEYIIAFFGCLYAGVIAVPAYPPRNNKHMHRLQSMMDDSSAKFVITNSKTANRFELKQSVINVDELEKTPPKQFRPVKAKSNDLAFLQYTSGSTGSPKGVMVLHSNIVANCLVMEKRAKKSNLTVGCSWVPMFHDMGLLGSILMPIYSGFKEVIFAPVTFIRNPIIWLELITKYKVSLSTAPNFAYDLCVQKARNLDSDEKLDIDLSSWKIALNGSEPVRKHSMDNFIDVFKDYGFSENTFWPCYGMAEATLFISGPTPGTLVKTLEGDIDHTLISSELVSCGYVAENHQLLIVDPKAKQPLKDAEAGEIWVSGPSITDGYWNKPKATEETFKAYLSNGEGPYLRTGDLGLLQDGQIYIVGRLKDIIIIRGENYAPQDIEHIVEQSHPGIRKQSSVAAISYEEEDEEKLAIIAEVERSYIKSDLDEIIKCIIQNIASDFEINVSAIVLLKPAGINRTTSGKIQRKACKKDFIEAKFSALKEWRASDVKQFDTQADIEKVYDDLNLEDLQQKLLSDIARELNISVESIDISKNIFALGVSSLQFASVMSKIEQAYNIRINLDNISPNKPISELLTGLVNDIFSTETPINNGDQHIQKYSDQKDGSTSSENNLDAIKQNVVMDVGLMFFESRPSAGDEDIYALFKQASKIADNGGFKAVWIPERHFHPFGGLYPNPAVLAGYLASHTKNVRIRSGAVVLPLHDVVRVAENWSVIDHLSGSRVDLGFAAGWSPNDYIFYPERYNERYAVFWRHVDIFNQLWQGNKIERINGNQEVIEIEIYPKPKRKDLDIWIICSGGEDRFVEAGTSGKNILTALLFQDLDELEHKIKVYRQARSEAGFDPSSGIVSLMLHTAIMDDAEKLKQSVEKPFTQYLKSSINLWKSKFSEIEPKSERESEVLLKYAFERYYQTKSLIITPDKFLDRMQQYSKIGVNEIATLIDFGMSSDDVMKTVEHLVLLIEHMNNAGRENE